MHNSIQNVEGNTVSDRVDRIVIMQVFTYVSLIDGEENIMLISYKD